METNNNKIDISEIYEKKDGIITDKSTGNKYSSYEEYIKCLHGNKMQAQNTVELLQSKIKTIYIICAAIWFRNGNKYSHQPRNIDSGIVVCGRRHHNCFLTASELNGGKRIEGLSEANAKAVQGFLTSNDIFVDRKEAGQIAFDAGQIPELTNCLFSEDLY